MYYSKFNAFSFLSHFWCVFVKSLHPLLHFINSIFIIFYIYDCHSLFTVFLYQQSPDFGINNLLEMENPIFCIPLIFRDSSHVHSHRLCLSIVIVHIQNSRHLECHKGSLWLHINYWKRTLLKKTPFKK